MMMDMASVSRWYVLNRGFKPYSQCPRCQSEDVLYFRVYRQGEEGIAPECGSCHKQLIIRWKPLFSKRLAPIHRREIGVSEENRVLNFN